MKRTTKCYLCGYKLGTSGVAYGNTKYTFKTKAGYFTKSVHSGCLSSYLDSRKRTEEILEKVAQMKEARGVNK